MVIHTADRPSVRLLCRTGSDCSENVNYRIIATPSRQGKIYKQPSSRLSSMDSCRPKLFHQEDIRRMTYPHDVSEAERVNQPKLGLVCTEKGDLFCYFCAKANGAVRDRDKAIHADHNPRCDMGQRNIPSPGVVNPRRPEQESGEGFSELCI